MWYIVGMSHPASYRVQIGDRGRMVLPAEVRKRLKLGPGDEVLVTEQSDGSLRLLSAQQVVRETRGLYRVRSGKRSLVDELIADRRAEARRERSTH